MVQNLLQRLTGQTLTRQISLKAESPKIDPEARTIELAFSSEEPVNRWGINEVLDHSSDAIDSTRLDNGLAPLLLNHDRNQLIGTVDSWRLDGDKVARATVRFSPHSELANQVFNEVKDGFRNGVSFGYRIIDGGMAKRNEEDYFIATRWLPVEISLEAIPADATVGVGRSLEGHEAGTEAQVEKPVDEQRAEATGEATPAVESPAVVPPADQNTEVKTTMIENDKAVEFMDFARAIGEEALGKEFVVNGRSIDELKTAVAEKLKAAGARTDVTPGAPVDGVPSTEIGMSGKEAQSYSLLRAIGAALTNDWGKAGFEREAGEAVAKRVGHDPKNGGFFVPYEVQNVKRDLSVGGGLATGGALVATELKAESFIDMLRSKSVIYALGAQRLTGLRGDIAIPKQTGASTAYWVKEGVAPDNSDPAFGQIAMSPKTLGDMVEFTRKLLMQSNPSVEALVYRDIAKVMALGIDKATINGLAANDEPVGILNQTGMGVIAGTGAAGIMQYSDFTDAEGLLEEANVEANTLAWLSRPAFRATLKSRTKVTGQPIYITSDNNTTVGYNHAVSTQLPTGKLIFGDFSQIVIGEWGVLEIVANPFGTGFGAGNVVIRALQSVDLVVRYPQAFGVNGSAS
jgi:HK97 family phage major capsid protein/HK97 family phage prohead protease